MDQRPCLARRLAIAYQETTTAAAAPPLAGPEQLKRLTTTYKDTSVDEKKAHHENTERSSLLGRTDRQGHDSRTQGKNIENLDALKNVRRELTLLNELSSEAFEKQEITSLKLRVSKVNESLWQIEDRIREKEAVQEFDSGFIELARSVYITNDKRAEIKREINRALASELIEEKSYKKYT